jgi:hypothetical protein
MSLSTDVLAKATPTRLMCRAGRWVLELSRLEAVDRDVYQPRLTRLEGADSILAVLRRSDEGQLLASGAAQIMRGPRLDEDRSFEVAEGDWVPSSDTGFSFGAPPPAPDEVAELTQAVAELRAELAVLRASHARLRDRVVALEAATHGLPVASARPPRGGRSLRRRSEPPPAGFAPAQAAAEALPAENLGLAATQASPGLQGAAAAAPPAAAAAAAEPVPAPPSPRPAAPGQPAPGSLEELARDALGEVPLPVLTVPTLKALVECIELLLENAPKLEPLPKPVPIEGLSDPLACKLLDDEGRERGAIVMDLRAAVLLGAGLLGVPREEALRQIKENETSEDALLATSEICNNLTGPVNNVKGNDHVRSTVLERVDAKTLPKPRARFDIGVDGGNVVIAMY